MSQKLEQDKKLEQETRQFTKYKEQLQGISIAYN